MTSKELLYVKTVADEKSISKAAKKLYMAQPSLSQSIQRLEGSLGTQLFNRTANGLTLTFAGERYYQIASQILKIYEDFEVEVSDINNLRAGKIHIGITPHLGTIVLTKVLPEFRKQCPYIEIYVTEDNSTKLEQKLLSGELDFAVMHSPKENFQPQINYNVIGKDPFLLTMSRNHPLVEKARVIDGYPYPVLDIMLIKEEPFIMLHKQQRIRQVADSVLKKAKITQPNIALTVKNFETAQLLASQGIGITFIPMQYSLIPSAEYTPAFLSIDKKYDASWDTCIATSKWGFLSKADGLFIEQIKGNFHN